MAQSKSFSLTLDERKELKQVLRQRKADGLIVRRANALLLLDNGWKADQVADALFLDAETIRAWRRHFLTHAQFAVFVPFTLFEA